MFEAFAKKHPLLYAFLYLFVFEAGGSAIVAGGLEFLIAWGMYRFVHHKVTLWAFPHTLSGDCALSLFIQVCITWCCEEILINWDYYNNRTCTVMNLDLWLFHKLQSAKGKISTRFLNWYLEIPYGIIKYDNVQNKNNSNKLSFLPFTRRIVVNYPNEGLLYNIVIWLLKKIVRGLLWSCVIFCIIWPVTMGIMAGIGTSVGAYDFKFDHYPTPQIMKLLYAVAVAYASTPFTIIVIILRNNTYELRTLTSSDSLTAIQNIDMLKAHDGIDLPSDSSSSSL
ncbi:hypothetical protein KAFR_0I01430 [Kazachstania africana CBS 2517]|uniref:Uncharacterized protein n=1 Tax=Kazachstania africana (strain ATCC 22294 / BCRC 22015 / CBS 2517 / CECT 1963 / NBRC 1671 / NRRL Y-8276) TaxID=1071382 RepID=H2AZX4_KAZAF|nr:hypothetical protein KAFR_0I01430 [Kazachstania africana CBS 2517]CCF59924.1 hypothetical protein KAFR_0I01430 [Kazachstania africana CBS 2517]